MNRRRTCGILAAAAAVLVLAGSAWGAAGELLWQRQITFLPGYDNIVISSMAASETSFFISGNARNTTDGTSIGFLKAFNADNGKPKWSKTLSIGTKGNGIGNLIVDGDLLLARGSAASFTQTLPDPPDYTLFKSFIWAYNAETGKLFWQVVKNFEVGPQVPPLHGAGASTTFMVNNRLFFAAFSVDANGKVNYDKFTIRAYQVK